ncbi:TonB-dependent siderophore receptor [Methylobacillus arboreus]|uniref:TonB-dependent siderophore receptor n=1 Tax=Methylobacillus arboreus TaxID=755170 RepID=UPI001E31F087|nr:TonB-dependent siderophore receptor [Methylobacillus arboreus]MCB5191180.1 TonB-dependent siderophore receptor [Methylobacillus arboreus]
MHHHVSTALFPKLKLAMQLLLMAGVFQGPQLVYAQENSDEELNPVALPVVTVVGSADKTGDNFKSTAQSVSIIDESRIKEIGANKKLDDLLLYETGILSQQFGPDNKSNWFKIRGFDANTTLDGTSVANNGFFVWEQEIYGLEKVEVLKGANSFNYGATDAGGTINLVSKRPKDIEQGEVSFSIGNFSRRTISGDYNGILSQEHGVRYRLVGLYSKGNFPQDHTGMEQYYFAPSIAWDITDRTSLTILASTLKKQGTPTSTFMPALGTLTRTGYGKIGYDTNLGEPEIDRFERKQYSLGYEFSHDFGNRLKFSQNYRYGKMDNYLLSVYANGNVSNDRESGRSLTFRDGESSVHTVDNRLSKSFIVGDIENTILLGLDYQRSRIDFDSNGFAATIDNIDMFNPQYGAPPTYPVTRDKIRHKQTGLYLSNKFNWNDAILVNLGIRRDNYETSALANNARTTGDNDKNTYNASIMFRAENGIAPYLSYSTSFRPILGTDANGKAYIPYEGEQYEAGIKIEPEWLKGSINLAAFNLKEKNALVSTGTSQVQSGERTNNGFEIQSDLTLNDNFSTRLNYTRNHVRQDTDTGTVRGALIPNNQFSAQIDYRKTEGEILKGLKLGIGVRYNGSTKDEQYHPNETIPSYTLVDAVASYPVSDHWNLQVNVYNLLNKEYLSVCDYLCYYGTSRTVDAQLSYHW